MRAEVWTPRRLSAVNNKAKNNGQTQAGIRNLKARTAQQIGHCLGAPNRADQRIENVVHRHGPSSDIAERGMQFAAHVGIGRSRAWINARHAPIAHRGKDHGHHRDENRSDDMALSLVAENSIGGHGRGRLNDDDAVHDQIPQRERAFQARGFNCGRFHLWPQYDLGKKENSFGLYRGAVPLQRGKSQLKRFSQAVRGRRASGPANRNPQCRSGYWNEYPRGSLPDMKRVLYSSK